MVDQAILLFLNVSQWLEHSSFYHTGIYKPFMQPLEQLWPWIDVSLFPYREKSWGLGLCFFLILQYDQG